MTAYERLIRQGQDRFRRQLASESLDSAKRLQKAYKSVLRDVDREIADLRKEAAKMASGRELAHSESLLKLRQRLRADLESFSVDITRESVKLQKSAAVSGSVVGMQNLQALNTGVGFSQPSTAAIRSLIKYTDSQAFKSSVEYFAPYHAERVTSIVLTGAAQGNNPVTIARDIQRYIDGYPLADAVRQVRTIQLYSARRGSQEVYQANADIVTGWTWSAAIGDPHTCLSCIAQHGQFFPVEEILNDHYQGRCAMVPVTGLLGVGNVQTGEEWFNDLPVSNQRDLMGGAKYAAYKDGLFEFSDMSAVYHDDLYGPMRHEASLRQLIGDSAAKDYLSGN
jgi:hypothetical protein